MAPSRKTKKPGGKGDVKSGVSPEPGSITRAREDGVREMVRMMAAGEWVTTQSTLAVAERFGVTPGTAAHWAGEASRQLRALAAMDREQLRDVFVSRFARLEAMALAKESVFQGISYPAPDVRTAVAAVAEQAKLLGLVVTKVEDVTAERAKFEALPREEQARQLERLEAEIRTQREALQGGKP